MPGPPAPKDVRLRKYLDLPIPAPTWPAGFGMRVFTEADAPALHALLTEVFDDGSDGPFETWWPRISRDAEFDPGLCFLVFGSSGTLCAAALCWNTAFIKDLAVCPGARRQGLGKALLLHASGVFRKRGARQVDLKTNLVLNAAAVELYRSLGMIEVDWEG